MFDIKNRSVLVPCKQPGQKYIQSITLRLARHSFLSNPDQSEEAFNHLALFALLVCSWCVAEAQRKCKVIPYTTNLDGGNAQTQLYIYTRRNWKSQQIRMLITIHTYTYSYVYIHCIYDISHSMSKAMDISNISYLICLR